MNWLTVRRIVWVLDHVLPSGIAWLAGMACGVLADKLHSGIYWQATLAVAMLLHAYDRISFVQPDVPK